MKFYMSYWCNKNTKNISEYLIDIHRLSVFLVKKHYKECHLITDSLSKPYFEDVGFTSITTELDALNDIESNNWALGKLYSYKFLSEKGVPFCHIDYDVFLWNKLPDKIFESEIFAQNIEKKVYDTYAFDIFKKHHKSKNFITSIPKREEDPIAYNVGIMGGNNLEFIKKYAETGIGFSLDKNNIECYSIMNTLQSQAIPCISEQYCLAVCSEKYNVPVTCLLKSIKEQDLEKEASHMGYTHLINHKHHPNTKDAIYLRLYENELKGVL